MLLNKKFPLISSIFLMLSLIGSTLVKLRFYGVLNIFVKESVAVKEIVFFLILWILVIYYVSSRIKNLPSMEKRIYYSWIVCGLLVHMGMFLTQGISIIINLICMVITSFSIYYSIKFLRKKNDQIVINKNISRKIR